MLGHLPKFNCPGELCPASSGQQGHEDTSSRPAETQKTTGQWTLISNQHELNDSQP